MDTSDWKYLMAPLLSGMWQKQVNVGYSQKGYILLAVMGGICSYRCFTFRYMFALFVSYIEITWRQRADSEIKIMVTRKGECGFLMLFYKHGWTLHREVWRNLPLWFEFRWFHNFLEWFFRERLTIWWEESWFLIAMIPSCKISVWSQWKFYAAWPKWGGRNTCSLQARSRKVVSSSTEGKHDIAYQYS